MDASCPTCLSRFRGLERRGTLACAPGLVLAALGFAEPSLALLAPLRCSLAPSKSQCGWGKPPFPHTPRSGRAATCLLQPLHGAERSEWRGRRDGGLAARRRTRCLPSPT